MYLLFKITLGVSLLFTLSGCEKKQKQHLDGEALIKAKCSSCHNLDLPPKTFIDEKAPPMMAVSFHIRDFIKVNNASEKIPKAIEFVKDYVVNPSEAKSFCDKESLKSYGLMPSQKGKVTQDELEAIAQYMFEHFTMKNLNEQQAALNRLNKMSAGERVASKYHCLSCHKKAKDLVAPSFTKIAKRYANDTVHIKESIKNGSAKKWQGYHGATMPAFKNKIDEKELETLAQWITHMKSE